MIAKKKLMSKIKLFSDRYLPTSNVTECKYYDDANVHLIALYPKMLVLLHKKL